MIVNRFNNRSFNGTLIMKTMLTRTRFISTNCHLRSTRVATSTTASSMENFNNSIKETVNDDKTVSKEIVIQNKPFKNDRWSNVPDSIIAKTGTHLHKLPNHPINILKTLIETHFQRHFPSGTFKYYDSFHPVVSIKENFDDLLIPKDHPGRLPTDTYYINETQVLRTHTSAHQMKVLSLKASQGSLMTADVYRRDSIDSSHYPVFHQMEGLFLFDQSELNASSSSPNSNNNDQNTKKLAIPPPPPKHIVQDLILDMCQPEHQPESSSLIATHLKRTLESLVLTLFQNQKDLKMRWIEGYFPFTYPSYELEVWYKNEWLELLGCGVIQQSILNQSGNKNKLGWAFGLGLERIAMVLFNIPDIRLFWSNDPRFLSQFSQGHINAFQHFSKYPVCYKDMSFWCPPSSPSASSSYSFNDNDFCDIAREIGGDWVESVKLIDNFIHKKTGRESRCYRVEYRSMERTLKNEEVDEVHRIVGKRMEERYNVDLR